MADNYGNTPIHFAASRGHLNVVWYFVQKAKVNPQEGNDTLNTPIHFAALNGHLKVVGILLKKPR